MSERTDRPPLDPQLADELSRTPALLQPLTSETLRSLRANGWGPPIEQSIAGTDIEMTTHRVPSHDGVQVDVHVFARRGHRDGGVPGVFYIHAGGMVAGGALVGLDQALRWVTRYDAVLASVEYRLAPEHPDPAPVEDAYAGLAWFARSAGRLAFDAGRVLVAGESAGGGIAAGITLLARDRGGPAIAWQLLLSPMLDDRDTSVSAAQFDDGVPWNRASNRAGWTALLGDRRGTDRVPVYAAPARADRLDGLPPAYLDAGSAEVFRDEVVEYASRIWTAGGDAELHIWSGGFHGFAAASDAMVAVDSRTAVDRWVERRFTPSTR